MIVVKDFEKPSEKYFEMMFWNFTHYLFRNIISSLVIKLRKQCKEKRNNITHKSDSLRKLYNR
jgi:hypothetical protein